MDSDKRIKSLKLKIAELQKMLDHDKKVYDCGLGRMREVYEQCTSNVNNAFQVLATRAEAALSTSEEVQEQCEETVAGLITELEAANATNEELKDRIEELEYELRNNETEV